MCSNAYLIKLSGSLCYLVGFKYDSFVVIWKNQMTILIIECDNVLYW